MAIIFHEGLPGAGKSYETCVYWMVPALESGRKVYAYVEGLNHEKFSEITGIPLPIIQKNLIQIEADQVKTIYAHIEKDSLVIIDELQNFFPSNRAPLDDDITKFVTEHRHEGLDIICMGQDLRDCHNLWKRRITQKVIFLKRDGIGKADSYKWEVHKLLPGKKDLNFQKISSGVKNYDSKYFGLYKSHTDGTSNFSTLKDDRANVFNTTLFRRTIPLVFLTVVAAVWYLFGFFTDPKMVQAKTVEKQKQVVQGNQLNSLPMQLKQQLPVYESDYITDIAGGRRLRLSGLVEGAIKLYARVQILDSGHRVKDELTIKEITSLGWTVKRTGYGLKMTKEGQPTLLVRAWPLDYFGKVSKSVQHSPALRTGTVPR